MKTTILYLEKKIMDYKLMLKEKSGLKMKRDNLSKSHSFSPVPKRPLNKSSRSASKPSVTPQDSDEDDLMQLRPQI